MFILSANHFQRSVSGRSLGSKALYLGWCPRSARESKSCTIYFQKGLHKATSIKILLQHVSQHMLSSLSSSSSILINHQSSILINHQSSFITHHLHLIIYLVTAIGFLPPISRSIAAQGLGFMARMVFVVLWEGTCWMKDGEWWINMNHGSYAHDSAQKLLFSNIVWLYIHILTHLEKNTWSQNQPIHPILKDGNCLTLRYTTTPPWFKLDSGTATILFQCRWWNVKTAAPNLNLLRAVLHHGLLPCKSKA